MIARFFVTLDFGEANACRVTGTYETSPPTLITIDSCQCDSGYANPTSNIFLFNLERKLGVPPYTFASKPNRKH